MQTNAQICGGEEAGVVFEGKEGCSNGNERRRKLALEGEGGDFGFVEGLLGAAACDY